MEINEQMAGLEELLPWNRSRTRQEACRTHGTFDAYQHRGGWSGCPTCAEEAVLEQARSEEAKKLQEFWEHKLAMACIPERFRSRTLDSFVASTRRQKDAKDFAEEFVNSFSTVLAEGRSALFLGKPGTGKTHLACGIGLRLMSMKHSVLFTTVQRVIRRVKDSWTPRSTESESEIVRTMTLPDLLILDEVGVQFGSDFEKQIMFDILNERYEKLRPTILLSNLTLEGVKTYLGDRISDRLRENGGRAIVFDWDSYR